MLRIKQSHPVFIQEFFWAQNRTLATVPQMEQHVHDPDIKVAQLDTKRCLKKKAKKKKKQHCYVVIKTGKWCSMKFKITLAWILLTIKKTKRNKLIHIHIQFLNIFQND